ncbi:MAG: helix-turn-helix domain-containing protein [Clostridia bacterium]|nr:helix-turn-helix domain-containing protein [Clostridia bacterium]
MDNMEKWVSLQVICKHLNLSRDTVKRLVYEESLPAYKPDDKSWRFKISEVDDWMKTRKITQKTAIGEKKHVKNH